MSQVNLNALERMRQIARHGSIAQVIEESRLNPLFRKMFYREHKRALAKRQNFSKHKIAIPKDL